MSYGILYRAIAIKHPLEDKYLILSEYGDNNVWEHNNKRRARSWQGDCLAGSHRGNFCTASELEARLKTVDFSSGCYAVYGRRNRDFAAHWGVYKKAIKNAVSFDQLPKFELHFSQWAGDQRYIFRRINDLETLVSEQNRLENEGRPYYLNCYVSDWDYLKIYPKVPRAERKPKIGTHCIYILGYGYLKKRGSRRVFPTSNKDWALQYSEKEATKLVELLNSRGFDCTFEVRPINPK